MGKSDRPRHLLPRERPNGIHCVWGGVNPTSFWRRRKNRIASLVHTQHLLQWFSTYIQPFFSDFLRCLEERWAFWQQFSNELEHRGGSVPTRPQESIKLYLTHCMRVPFTMTLWMVKKVTRPRAIVKYTSFIFRLLKINKKNSPIAYVFAFVSAKSIVNLLLCDSNRKAGEWQLVPPTATGVQASYIAKLVTLLRLT